MATLTFNGNSFTVHHAVKGADYVHGYDVNGACVVSLDGVTDFSGISYDGVYMDPSACLDEACNDVKYCNGTFMTRGGTEIQSRELLWENPSPTDGFALQTIDVDYSGYFLLLFVFNIMGGTSNTKCTFWVDPSTSIFNATYYTLKNGYERQIAFYADENKIKFSTGTYAFNMLVPDEMGHETGKGYMIPLKIYGIK